MSIFDRHLRVRDSVEAHVELGVDCVAEVHHDLQEKVGEEGSGNLLFAFDLGI